MFSTLPSGGRKTDLSKNPARGKKKKEMTPDLPSVPTSRATGRRKNRVNVFFHSRISKRGVGDRHAFATASSGEKRGKKGQRHLVGQVLKKKKKRKGSSFRLRAPRA